MTELAFSFTDCAVIPQEPSLVVSAWALAESAVVSVRSTGRSVYVYMMKAGRSFRGWLTVTAKALSLNAAVRCRRILGAAVSRFSRSVFLRQGRLRL